MQMEKTALPPGHLDLGCCYSRHFLFLPFLARFGTARTSSRSAVRIPDPRC